MAKPKLGEILMRAGVLELDQLRAALGEQQRWGGRLGQKLVGMGALDEKDLVRALASQLGIPVVQLEGKRIEDDILELIPVELAEKHGCIPLFAKQVGGVQTLYIGMEDPSDVEALDELRFRCEMHITPVMVSVTDLSRAIARCYPGATRTAPIEAVAPNYARENVLEAPEEEGDLIELQDLAEVAKEDAPQVAAPQSGNPAATTGDFAP